MSYTRIIENQQDCNYINPMKDNAEVMLNPCINNPNIKPDYTLQDPGNLCTGKPVEQTKYHNFYTRDNLIFKTYDINTPEERINFTEQFNNNMLSNINSRRDHIIKKQHDLINYLNTDNNNIQVSFENYNKDIGKQKWQLQSGTIGPLDKPVETHEPNPQFPTYVPPKKIKIYDGAIEEPVKDKESKDGDLIEGFMAGDFLSDSGPGEQYIDVCPDEYEYCNVTKMCKKKCNHCKTEYDDSDYTDICYPNNYDGIDNFGRIMCSRTKNIHGNTVRISTQLSHINSKEQLFSHYDHNNLYMF